MCVNSFHHICPVKITISYVYARETIVPLWKTKLCGKLPDHWVLMFCLENKWFGCCNVYLCALCFCIIAGSLTCWCKPEQKVFCLTSWWKGERVLTWFWYIKVITITCISSFFKVAKYSTIWPAHYFFFFLFFSVIIILASLQWFCTLYVESSMGFPPDFLKNAFCHVSELKSLLRSWKFVLLYHDKAAVLSLIEIVYPGSRCVGYFIIQNLISMANGFALSLQGTWIHI